MPPLKSQSGWSLPAHFNLAVVPLVMGMAQVIMPDISGVDFLSPGARFTRPATCMSPSKRSLVWATSHAAERRPFKKINTNHTKHKFSLNCNFIGNNTTFRPNAALHASRFCVIDWCLMLLLTVSMVISVLEGRRERSLSRTTARLNSD